MKRARSKKKFVFKNLTALLVMVPVFLIVGVVLLGNVGLAKEAKEKHAPVCAVGNQNEPRCHARVVVDQNGTPKAAISPAGYGPKQLLGAYNLSGSVASGSPILAIVDAYDHPYIKSDLDTYNSYFKLPYFPQCSGAIKDSSVPCFQKLNQRGRTTYPSINAGWGLEISLDVEVAHAVCPSCRLLLVEADSSSYANLMAAVDQAVAQGATFVSNSYGSSEFSGETSYDVHLNKPGIVFTFSSGDNGYGASYPAASPYVTAVGGTTLVVNGDNTYGGETAWSGAGSGCSAYEFKPGWQLDTGCAKRSIADVSAVADPNTGAAVYDSLRYQGKSGWFKVGGTSLAAPLIAGVYALANNVSPTTYGVSLPYANAANLHDVVSGSNGSCGGIYLCTALSGYDGPTGLGSPKGITGF
jgi:subtilase family serine protease